MDGKCRAYNGDMPYGFISYAHADNGRVLPVIRELYRKKYRIWYDEGIEVGVNWPQKVAGRLKSSELVILFLSKSFLASQNCMRELNYAVAEKRRMLCVLMEDVTLPEDVAMQLSTVEKLDARRLSTEETAASLIRPGALDEALLGDGAEGYGYTESGASRSRNIWRIVSVMLLLMLAAGGVLAFGYVRGWFGAGVHSYRETVVSDGASEELTLTTWSDPVARDLMLRSMSGTAVYLCGNASLNLPSEIRYRGGEWYAGSQRVENGGIEDLSPLKGKPLVYLAVVDQRLTDAEGLSDFPELIYLDISGNEISDLSPLRSLEKLEVLKLQRITATDLSVLKELPSLRAVYISEDMFPIARDILDGDFDVTVKR